MNKLLKLTAVGALATIGLVGLANSAKAQLDESQLIPQQPREILACVNDGSGGVALVPQQIQEYASAYNSLYIVTDQTKVLQQGEPNIVFTKTLHSANPKGAYTPESRCQAIRDRVTNLKNSLGIESFAELSRIGKVNGQKVIAVNKVSRQTVVMTLSGENGKWKVAKYEVLPKFQAFVNSPFTPAATGPILE
ncbi:COP23 domain-containing protein [Gloeothece verrucosa]|uniref:Uncharacterized protein n=1 Tax=Gloeothece verrucosa (strain PCC 7822) TaxID=497965 RepID=E0U5J0_GLOV7|nr:COP23 domain-containing protein [Gloeothece verrucosa]ADN14703.1 conserved hypothetical protein [Gloeothece verrucosa PCC 7822]